jgi:hypothetical protein
MLSIMDFLYKLELESGQTRFQEINLGCERHNFQRRTFEGYSRATVCSL